MNSFFSTGGVSLIILFLMVAVLEETHTQTLSKETIASRKPATTPTLIPTYSVTVTAVPTYQPPSQSASQSNDSTPLKSSIQPLSTSTFQAKQHSNDVDSEFHVYTPGHIACAVIGSITLAIWILLCIYSGRNRRAFKRDMKTFYGAENAHILDKASTTAAMIQDSFSSSASNNNNSSGYTSAHVDEEV